MIAVDLNDFLTTGNQIYISEVYEQFLDDPGSVDPHWQTFFADLNGDLRELLQEKQGFSWASAAMRSISKHPA